MTCGFCLSLGTSQSRCPSSSAWLHRSSSLMGPGAHVLSLRLYRTCPRAPHPDQGKRRPWWSAEGHTRPRPAWGWIWSAVVVFIISLVLLSGPRAQCRGMVLDTSISWKTLPSSAQPRGRGQQLESGGFGATAATLRGQVAYEHLPSPLCACFPVCKLKR